MIRELKGSQLAIMYLGAILMLAGLILQLFIPQQKFLFSVIYLAGTTLFGLMQAQQSYEGDNVRLRRLRRQQLSSDIFLFIAGLMMIAGFLTPYCRHLEWLVAFTIGSIQQLWTSVWIPVEVEKEEKRKGA